MKFSEEDIELTFIVRLAIAGWHYDDAKPFVDSVIAQMKRMKRPTKSKKSKVASK